MARIRDPLAAERPVPRQLGGVVRLRGPQPTGAVGQGLQVLGREAQAGFEEIYREQKVEEDRINRLRAEEAFTELRERQLDLTFGEQAGFTRVQGSKAVSTPILKEWNKRFNDAEGEITAKLGNQEQREHFKRRAEVARLQYNEEILRHLARERDNYSKQVFEGVTETERRAAVARWDSPNDVASSIERIRAAVEERAQTYGWEPKFRDAIFLAETSKLHDAVIRQAIATGNYRYGEQWYEQHRAQIDLPTAQALETAVAQGTQKELVNRYNADYLANEASAKGLEALRTRVMQDTGLDEDRRNLLVGRIQNRQFVLERRAEVAQERRLRRIERSLTTLNSSTLAGFEPNPAQFTAVLGAAKGTELEPEVRQAMKLAEATRSFRNSPPVTQEQILAQAEAGLRTEPTKFDRQVVGAWRQIYEAQRRQVQENPVGFAVRQGIVFALPPLDLSKPEALGEALHERFAIARGMRARYQAPFKPLTAEEEKLLATNLKGATVEQKRNYFASLAMSSGADLPGYMAIMEQLSPDDPVTAIAGSRAGRGHTVEADTILRGQAILAPSRRSDGRPDGASLLPMPPETDLRMRFDAYVRDAFTERAEARNAHYQAAKAAYAALSIEAGDRDTKVLDMSRWERAIEIAVGTVERYRGRRIVLPHGYDYGRFRDELAPRLNALADSGRLEKTWTGARLQDLALDNVGDGRYVLRAGDGLVVDKTGARVTVNFNLPAPERLAPEEVTPEELEATAPAYFGRARPKKAP